MKVLEIIPQLSSGGAERFVVDLCNELCQRHNVTLMVYYNLAEHGFYLHELSTRVKVISLDKKIGRDFRLFQKVDQVIKSIRPDVVHIHTRAINYIFPSLLIRRGLKCFMTIHSAADKEAGNKAGKILRKILFRGRIVPVTISEESLRSFKDFYGIDAPMIPNGRNVKRDRCVPEAIVNEVASYKKTSKTRVLVNVARFTEVKRQDMLARIIARLSGEGYDITSLFIGKHLDKDVLNDVRKVKCEDIHILGEKNNPLDYLMLADAFCLCSSYEGMPISLIEAMGLGIVPVCTPVGGIVDVIDQSNGFLSDNLSEEAYYGALKRFLETDQAELDVMRNSLIASYEPYSMSECALKYETLFKG